jgi:RAQPRD family integrative conjugative element protein
MTPRRWALGMLAATLAAAAACADPDAERSALARLAHEIEALAPLVRQAERAADPDARIRFEYAWLRRDLAQIERGIREHLEAPRTEPRQVPPLLGDYRH